jgi:hypothetical protein
MRTPLAYLRLTVALLVALSIGLVVDLGRANGSSPTGGTLTNAGGPLTWTGGPFAAPNATGNVTGTPDCSVPQSCDDYTLTVNTRPGTGDTHDLKIVTSWTTTGADFDVYVLDRAGNVVASAASSSEPETITMPPTSGVYTVRVVPYTPLGATYTAKASLVTKPNDGAPASTAPAPSFRNFAAPKSLPDVNNAGEPSIGYDSKHTATMYQASLSTYRVHFNDTTTPTSASWTDVSAKAANGCPQGGTTSLDPILYTDRKTGRTFESQLSGADSLTCYTDDAGKTWNVSQGGGIPSGVDHQTVGGGAFAANDPLNATNTYSRAVYYCSQDIATAFCALSRNGGTTFGPGVTTYNLMDCGGLHGHIAVAPDGTAYLPNRDCNGHQAVVVSSDNGQTWAVRPVPNSTSGDTDPAAAVGANGTLYYGYADGSGAPKVAVSHDKGKTWATNFNVGKSLGIKNVVFPTVVAGDDNRAAFSFLGTTTGGNYQDINNFKGVWYVYTAFTYDGGKTWKTVNDTPGNPVQRGSICTGGTTCGKDRNLLDFIGSTIDSHGRVEVGYADGCTGACVTGGKNNRDAYASITRQASGLTLFGKYDPKPNLTVTAVSTKRAADGTSTVSATMRNAGRAKATAPVRFLIDGRTLTTTGLHTLPAGRSITLSAKWDTRHRNGKHTITAVADPRNVVHESNEADNKRARTVQLP